MDKLAAVYAAARQRMQQFFDGVCSVYVLQAQEEAGICYGGAADWQPLADWQEIPCHLSFEQQGPAETDALADGSRVEARGRLFLAAAAAAERTLPAGSRVRVEQQGRTLWLDCSGLAAEYPTHMEVEVRLLDRRA